MPPKRKDFLKLNPKAKAKAQEPQSENDFLEAADEFEQAAGKWRAGDAAKATRFYNRAIDMYNVGLRRYPSSFDLSYNKANLEYKMSEDERIAALLGNKVDLLEETLRSHRTAIALNPDNTDVLFNTGQVLTSLAEALLESRTQEIMKASAITLLEEAINVFAKCLASQQHEYEEIQIEIARAQASQEPQDSLDTPGHIVDETTKQESMEMSSTSSDGPGEWATVVEPVTPEAILETCIAYLETLSILIGLYGPSELAHIEQRAQTGLETANIKIPALIGLLQISPKTIEEPVPGPTLSIASQSAVEEPKSSPKDDASLAAAKFRANVAEVSYRTGQTTIIQYAGQIEQIFAPLIEPLHSNTGLDPGLVNSLSVYADTLMDLASAISDSSQHSDESSTHLADYDSQWAALTQAQTILTQISSGTATSSLSPSRLADIFLARGDADLFRFRISLLDIAKPAWAKSKMVLVSNAGVYYRGARMYAEKADDLKVHKAADAKATIAELLKEAANGSNMRKLDWKSRGEEVVRMLEQMIEEGIVGKENAEGVMRYIE
ncbi:uncharacterized protein BDR25DRAFT_277843 [Lindgomyces ingoldianus]|uniref:Uncharacterized protein n=1 Tax=Lindgomyces ingoldianus TaxID=673940 RepID=A0ACB6RBR9_9PLEO|nr:uncharacterized protein BDR25DRAFT_277843 [Lindgomyces ingoldianus]KAF2476591.1 hypothetical protein BDR25DRAFT_277843 [Lindgomyces ingoldianus]